MHHNAMLYCTIPVYMNIFPTVKLGIIDMQLWHHNVARNSLLENQPKYPSALCLAADTDAKETLQSLLQIIPFRLAADC